MTSSTLDNDENGDILATDEPEEVGGRQSPLRRCVVTGTVGPCTDMVRFVLGPDDTVVPDVASALPGRGYWVLAQRPVLEQAVARKAFHRAMRHEVKVRADLVLIVATLLRQRCLDFIGFARRAGQAVCGFDKVRTALKDGSAAVLLAASDGADDGRNKLRALAGGKPVVELFDSPSLGAAFGRDCAVHGVITHGSLAKRFVAEVDRYQGFASVFVQDATTTSGLAQNATEDSGTL